MPKTVTARFNYTGRDRIELDRASVSLELDGENVIAVLNVIDLDYFLTFDPSAQVVVILKRRTTAERVEFGTIASLTAEERRPVRQFSDPIGVKAMIRVVSTSTSSEGLLLGSSVVLDASNEDSPDDSPLLLFQKSEIGCEIWRLSFEGDTPTVLINSAIDDWQGQARDLRFQALVFPEIARRVANWLIQEADDDSEETDLAARWRSFFNRIGAPMAGVDASNSVEVMEWADSCADAVATRQSYLLRYINLNEEDQ